MRRHRNDVVYEGTPVLARPTTESAQPFAGSGVGGAEPLLKPDGKRRHRRKAEKAKRTFGFAPPQSAGGRRRRVQGSRPCVVEGRGENRNSPRGGGGGNAPAKSQSLRCAQEKSSDFSTKRGRDEQAVQEKRQRFVSRRPFLCHCTPHQSSGFLFTPLKPFSMGTPCITGFS